MLTSHLFSALSVLAAPGATTTADPTAISAVSIAPGTRDPREELVAGIESIRTIGSPGSIAVWGKEAFVIVAGEGEGDTRAPLVAAATLGGGRVVLFGHAYLGADAFADAPTKTFVERTIEWACGKEARKPRRVLVFDGGPGEALDARQFALTLAESGWEKHLSDFDAVLATKLDFDSAQIESLGAWVRAGGALLAGQPGWGWMQIKKNELVTHPVNRIVADAGLAFAEPGCAPGKGERFTLDAPPPFTHAGVALRALTRPEAKLEKRERAQALAAVTAMLPLLPEDDRSVRPELEEMLRKDTSAHTPTPEHPIAPDDVHARIAVAYEMTKLARTPVEKLREHPSASSFPGSVPADAVRVRRRVDVDLRVPRWHATGLYAPAGARIVIEIPESAISAGLRARIGVHSDSIWEKSWPRMPEISRSFALDGKRTPIASSFGGLIEIEVPRKSQGSVEVSLDGAVEAPLFELGKTSVEEWKLAIRARPAPWAELGTSKVILAVPSSSIRALDDPEALLRYWDRILDAMADFAARPRERESPERYVADVMISAGYMHSGYPIMTFLDAVADEVSLERMQRGPWGLLHELGHNHQQDDWTFEGTGEVTNNVFVLYVLDKVCGVDWRKGDGGHEALKDRAKRFDEYVKKGRKYADWCKDPFLALGMYIELQESFGWEPFTKVFAEYRALAQADRPQTEQDERDQWCTRFSRTVGKDLGPFFERWGVPVSEKARASLRDLPAWSSESSTKR